MQRYFLPEHVYFCGRGTSLIFLDLRHDSYVRIGGDEASAFCTAFSDSASGECASDSGSPLSKFLSRGLLTTSIDKAKPVSPTEAPLPVAALLPSDARPTAPIRVADVIRFIWACTAAATRLRLQPIESIVKSVRCRKYHRQKPDPIDLSAIRSLVAAFQRLRVLFPANYLCLFDSLALIEFLACYDFYPTWIFAVRFDPWAAHCWLQVGEVAVNEDPEITEDYTPIMEV
jgi:hypothetical protein